MLGKYRMTWRVTKEDIVRAAVSLHDHGFEDEAIMVFNLAALGADAPGFIWCPYIPVIEVAEFK